MGRQKLKHKDIVKRNLGVMNISLDNWEYEKKLGKKISKITSSDTIGSY